MSEFSDSLPQFYYSSYALGISLLLLRFKNKLVSFFKKTHLLKFVLFIGSNTFWIYLWHIPIVEFFVGKYSTLLCFVLVFSIALLIVYAQNKLVDLVIKHVNDEEKKRLIRMVFIG